MYKVVYHSTHAQDNKDDINGDDKVSISAEDDEKHPTQQEVQ